MRTMAESQLQTIYVIQREPQTCIISSVCIRADYEGKCEGCAPRKLFPHVSLSGDPGERTDSQELAVFGVSLKRVTSSVCLIMDHEVKREYAVLKLFPCHSLDADREQRSPSWTNQVLRGFKVLKLGKSNGIKSSISPLYVLIPSHHYQQLPSIFIVSSFA